MKRQIGAKHEFGSDDRLLACYQLELQLDALWSAARAGTDKSLPVHGKSMRSLHRGLDSILRRALE